MTNTQLFRLISIILCQNGIFFGLCLFIINLFQKSHWIWIMKVVIHWTKVIIINYERIRLNDSLLQITLLNNVHQEPILAIIMSSDSIWTVFLENWTVGEFVWPFGSSLLTIFLVKLWTNKRLKDAAVSQAVVTAECVISWPLLEHVFLSSALTLYDVDPEELGLRHKQCHTFLFFIYLFIYFFIIHSLSCWCSDTQSLDTELVYFCRILNLC